ncbi:MAG TPA: hypothetical protein VMH02_07170 [Verrucomicrobiae bacterium]|nr:hypothetical protein [Verrucomicrobiae bacterium]
MISEERAERHPLREWSLPLLLSVLIHALAVPWALWALSSRLLIERSARPPLEEVVNSTAVRIEHRRPVPRPRAAPPHAAARSAAPPQRAAAERVPVPQPRPSELAVVLPSATPVPPRARPQAPSTFQEQVAQQERAFSDEVARLRKADNPLSIATTSPQPATAYHRAYFDVPGRRQAEAAQALLFPQQHWFEGTLSCYYVRYAAQFSTGASEQGVVPWPVCYPRNDDRIAEFPYPGVRLPIPYPQPGYVLPPGTFLSPFLRRIYTRTVQ